MPANSNTFKSFLANFNALAGDSEQEISVCREYRKNPVDAIVVVANCLVQVFEEIQDYLDYYESDIVTSLGASLPAEHLRIQKEILSPFRASIRSASEEPLDQAETLGHLISASAELVRAWTGFERENLQSILSSSPEA